MKGSPGRYRNVKAYRANYDRIFRKKKKKSAKKDGEMIEIKTYPEAVKRALADLKEAFPPNLEIEAILRKDASAVARAIDDMIMNKENGKK